MFSSHSNKLSMNDINFITKLFNIEFIPNIDYEKTNPIVDGMNKRLELYLERTMFRCPNCDSLIFVKDTRKEIIKHTLRGGEACTIIFHKRRFYCPTCHSIISEKINGLNHNKGISNALDLEILSLLRDPRLTYQMIGEKLNVSSTHVMNIFDKYVDVKRHKLPEVLSIDEIYSDNLSGRCKYCLILFDPINKLIIDVIDSRRKKHLIDYFKRIKYDERLSVKYVTIDLYRAYRSVSHSYLSDAIIAADSFHVIENLNRLFDKVRLRVMKRYENYKGDLDFNYWIFKKYYKFLLMDFDSITNKEIYFKKKDMYLDKYYIRDKMLELDRELEEAYNLKEEYRYFNLNYKNYKNHKEVLESLIKMFMSSTVEEMNEFGRLLIHWKNEILNSFTIVNGIRLSNSYIERNNEEIGKLFYISHGFSNFKRARNRIMYSLNGDEPILVEMKDKTLARKFPRRKK